MNENEFIFLCSQGGYATKKQAEEYCKTHSKEEYTEAEFAEVYRFANSVRHGGHRDGWKEALDGKRSTINYRHRGLHGNSSKEQDC